jgi:DNA-binding response OmpR family regulator
MSVARKILVADDNRDLAAALSVLLASRGHAVRVAHTGEDACIAAMEFRPHVAVLDIDMPLMSGHEVAREIRRQVWGRDVLLVALSGWGGPTHVVHALDAGFDHHREKPSDLAEILSLVERTAV